MAKNKKRERISEIISEAVILVFLGSLGGVAIMLFFFPNSEMPKFLTITLFGSIIGLYIYTFLSSKTESIKEKELQ